MSSRKGALSTSALFVCIHIIVAPSVAASALLARKFGTSAHGDVALTLIQASARVQNRTSFDPKKPRDPKQEPPRMYVSEGCDGSTATLQHAVRILALHQINAEDPYKNREMLIPEGNSFLKSGGVGIIDSLALVKRELARQGKVLVFKSIFHRDKEPTLDKKMLDMGTLAVYVTRNNPLDQMVCEIRDCWLTNERYGQPVTRDGKPTHVCFDRRDPNDWGHDTEESDKAKLNVTLMGLSLLDENLNRMKKVTSSGYNELLKAGYQGPRLAYEDLIAFEKGGDTNIQNSLEQWQKLLVAWGVDPQMGSVLQYLKSHSGTWDKHSHRDTIYNYDEVKAELKRLGKEDLLNDE